MFKLIRADLYKSFHRIYLLVFMAVMAALAIFINSVFASMHTPLESSLGTVPYLLMYPLFIISMFADIVTAEENKEHTMKNTISFGISRTELFLAKIISTILVAFSVALVTVAAYMGSAFVLLRPESNDISSLLLNLFLRIGTALLIYIAAAILATLLAAVVQRNAMFTFAYFGALIVPVLVLKLLNLLNPIFGQIQNKMLFMQSQIIAVVPQAQLVNTVWIALIHIVIFTGLGLLLFRQQEVN